MFCKQLKNRDESQVSFLDFSLDTDIVPTNVDTNGGVVSLCKEKLAHNRTIELKLCSTQQFMLVWGGFDDFLKLINLALSKFPDVFFFKFDEVLVLSTIKMDWQDFCIS